MGQRPPKERKETPSAVDEAVEEQYFEAMMPVTILNDFAPRLKSTIVLRLDFKTTFCAHGLVYK